MDKKTYKALGVIVDYLSEQLGTPIDDEIEQVLNWMDEIAKDYVEA